MQKVRLVYSKSKESIYMSHLDIVKVFEQALSRANILCEYSKGFNPRPELVFAHPLALGIESIGDILEVTLVEKIQIPFLIKELNNVLPNGIIILSGEYVDQGEKNIMSRVYAAIYIIEFVYPKNMFLGKNNKEVDTIKEYYKNKMEEYLSQQYLLVLKKSKNRMERIDIKPQIITYEFLIDGTLEVTIATGSNSNLKPDNIMIGFNEYIDDKLEYNIKRTKILYK